MKRVYILTFHSAINYGAVLQCTALYKTIERFANCDIIDYRAPQICQTYAVFSSKRSLKQNIRGVLLASRTNAKRKKFNEFLKKNVTLTKPFFNLAELEKASWEKSDVFCVGSDQVWNLELTNYDSAYFYSFIPSETRKISYAASIGRELNDAETTYMSNLLQHFHAISVRESSAYQILMQSGIRCHQNIDPVYLLSQKQWKEMSIQIPEEDSEYILVYLLQKAPRFMQQAYKYSRKHEIKMIVITAIELHKLPDVVYVEQCGPQEFLRYIMKARMIFTNSFHGISMSIIFNKLFFFDYLAAKFNTNSRLKDIINLFDLHAQNANLYNMIPEVTSIDYEKVNNIIKVEQEKAYQYLSESIGISDIQ